ncbi:hypothetical protein PLICRDRAFT_170693 [Plicaturopsis crispa FD-325 SS-3]|nr:hypothetical protein PLICRDRAFT_170693 [Plicaturopsis crispa FD-325 SS-3]
MAPQVARLCPCRACKPNLLLQIPRTIANHLERQGPPTRRSSHPLSQPSRPSPSPPPSLKAPSSAGYSSQPDLARTPSDRAPSSPADSVPPDPSDEEAVSLPDSDDSLGSLIDPDYDVRTADDVAQMSGSDFSDPLDFPDSDNEPDNDDVQWQPVDEVHSTPQEWDDSSQLGQDDDDDEDDDDDVTSILEGNSASFPSRDDMDPSDDEADEGDDAEPAPEHSSLPPAFSEHPVLRNAYIHEFVQASFRGATALAVKASLTATRSTILAMQAGQEHPADIDVDHMARTLRAI